MDFGRMVLILFSVSLLVFIPLSSSAQLAQLPNGIPLESIFRPYQVQGAAQHSWFLGVKKFLNSFTSYQFPNPYPPNQDPLSRLEFPIDQFFIGGSAVYDAPEWAARAEGWYNLNRESRLRMQDSDWEDDQMPFQKTIFSESQVRLNRGILIDLGVHTPNLGILPRSIRPVVGYRYQYFYFTTHDGEQYDVRHQTISLDGDGIDFEQIFYHFYFGAVLDTHVNLQFLVRGFQEFRLTVTADYAVITAKNEDLHLLRTGERVTREYTMGHCWHVGVRGNFLRIEGLRLFLEGDFKRIVTHGDHRLSNNPLGVYFAFDGSKVWSDQMSLTAFAELIF